MPMTDQLRRFLKRKFVRDTLALQIGKIGTTLLTLLSALLVARLLGTSAYGVWALAQSILSIALTLNLTGLNTSISIQLPMAVGARSAGEILNLLAVYVKVGLLWSAALTVVLFLAGPSLAGQAYAGESYVGLLAAWLSLTVLPDMLYNLFVMAIQSQRSMRTIAVIQNLNQLVLLLCTLVALLLSPTPEGMVASRVAYSIITALIALAFYNRLRQTYQPPYPPLIDIIRHIPRVPMRPYLGFGFLNALDKSVANLYTEIPLQFVGIVAGKTAAGYLELAFKALSIPATFTSALFENIQAVVPQAIGRGDYRRLRQNFLRVVLALLIGGSLFYALFALTVPVFIPILFQSHWTPAIPVVITLAVYGAVTTVGGVFGPLYRGLNLMPSAITAKVIALLVLIPGWLALQNLDTLNHIWQAAHLLTPQPAIAQHGAIIGAWMINALLAISILLTAAVSLPVLRQRAAQSPPPAELPVKYTAQ